MTNLTPEELALYQQQLTEARAAYHTMMTTGKAVRIAHGDREVEYNRISAKDLLAYIGRLEALCGSCSSRRRPIMFGSNPRGCL